MLRMVVVIVVLFRDVRMLELQSTGPDVNLAKFLEKLKTRLGLNPGLIGLLTGLLRGTCDVLFCL